MMNEVEKRRYILEALTDEFRGSVAIARRASEMYRHDVGRRYKLTGIIIGATRILNDFVHAGVAHRHIAAYEPHPSITTRTLASISYRRQPRQTQPDLQDS